MTGRRRIVRYLHEGAEASLSEAATKTRQQSPGPVPGARAVHPGVPVGEPLGGRAEAAMALQRSAGNRAVSALVRSSLPSQTLQRCSCSKGDGKCAKCQHDDQEVLRRSAEPGASPVAAESATVVQSVLDTPGRALEAGLRQDMEVHFGVSLGGVRVHTDSAAAKSAEAVDARAYTVGHHIVFGASNWSPHTSEGRHLLAHELAHTIQQRGASRSLQPALVSDSGSESIAEHEAEAAAEAVTRGSRPAVVHQSLPVLRRAKRKKGSGAGNTVKGKIINEAAGGCGACYGPAGLKDVGIEVHKKVLARVRKAKPWLVNDERLKMAGASGLDIPDLFEYVGEKPGATRKVSRVGELKPDSNSGRGLGTTQLARYFRNIPQLPQFRDTDIEPLTITLPDGFDFEDPTRPAGCPKQTIKIRKWKAIPGLYLYRCLPPWKELVKNPRCKCAWDKKDEDDKKKKKKKNQKQDPKKSKKSDPKQQKKKPPAKQKPKKPAPKKAPKLKKPGAKAFSLVLGIGIGGSGTSAGAVGVGISVNSSGTTVGGVGASMTLNSDGDVIAGAGLTAAKDTSTQVAGGASVAASDQSSTTGAGVLSKGTSKKDDFTGAGVISSGSSEGGSGTGVMVKTSGDAKDADVSDPKSGTAGGGATGGKAGQKAETTAEPSEEAVEGAPGTGTAGTAEQVRNSPEFKQAQAEAKKIEAMLAGASAAQKKLIAELIKRDPDQLLPVADEAFTRKWLNATAGIKEEHVPVLADAGWVPGMDIEEAEFKRRVEQVISGKLPKGELWTAPTPPPPPAKTQTKDAKPPKAEATTPPPKDPKQPAKTEPKKEPSDEDFRGVIDTQVKAEGKKPEDLRKKLQKLAEDYDWASMTAPYQGPADTKKTDPQLTVMFFKSRKAVALVVVRLTKKGTKNMVRVLDASEAVNKEGDTFPVLLIGQEVPVTLY